MSGAPVSRTRAILILASTMLLGWGVWWIFRPRPTLAQALALAEARQLDAADEHIRRYLREFPESDGGHLLFAQIQTGLAELQSNDSNLPDPQYAMESLAHLERVRPVDHKMAASVKLSEGKAQYYLSRFDEAEASWNEAVKLDPRIPVAGWSLLDLYYIQGRNDEARSLALRLFEVEPDPHDRVQLLLELVRQDAQPPAPASIVQWFEPRVRQNPGDVHANMALGAALVRDGKTDRGLKLLEATVQHHPQLADTWEAWLTGLDDANQVGAEPLSLLVQATERLPSALAVAPRFARFQARAAQERGNTKEAVAAYRRAATAAPRDQRVEYRFIRALRQIGETHEAEQREHVYHTRLAASQEVRSVYMRVNAVKTLGTQPHRDLYQEVADLRERMALPEEARAWHRLVLRDDPDNSRSQIALQRLQRLQRLQDPGRATDARQSPPNASAEPHVNDARGTLRDHNSSTHETRDYTSVMTTLRA
jgi:tetratricopeptide (TPR) repeat protein